MIACKPLSPMQRGRGRQRPFLALLVLAVVATAFPTGASAEQASQPGSAAAGRLDVSGGTGNDPSGHSCAVQGAGEVRCWGYGAGGRLGYPNVVTPANPSVGDDEPPGGVGPIQVGGTATAISAGAFHNCALLDGGSVRCWGFGGEGRLGYPNVVGPANRSIGDNETPASVGPIQLGGTAAAISAGGGHSCAVLDGGSVRCWGFGSDGRLGYGNRNNIGDDETPSSVGPVDLGAGSTAAAISAGGNHTCALLHGGSVRCWGYGFLGRLGYGNQATIGRDQTPGSTGPVDLGPGRSATAISAGDAHTCALLDDGSVRCWGYGFLGRLGYGNQATIGRDQTPGSTGPVDLGPGRSATAISAGDAHTCALLDDGSVRCWGYAKDGRLGYANTNDIGDNEPPGSVGPVDLGTGRTATAISAGGRHTCARFDDGSVRCWGYGFTGRLGYCNQDTIGDDEVPGQAGAVKLSPGNSCPAAGPFTAKLALVRARIIRRDRVLDVLAPITSLASGSARVQLHAAGLLHSFTATVNSRDGRIRFRKLIPKAQAALGTGIITIEYPGDADTRPQTVRLRAASQPARLTLTRPTISAGRLRAAGTVSKQARGVVRVQIQYVVGGKTSTLEFKARIANGRWSLNERLSQIVRTRISRRTGSVHSYTLFTGYYQRRVRGEMRSYQILGPR